MLKRIAIVAVLLFFSIGIIGSGLQNGVRVFITPFFEGQLMEIHADSSDPVKLFELSTRVQGIAVTNSMRVYWTETVLIPGTTVIQETNIWSRQFDNSAQNLIISIDGPERFPLYVAVDESTDFIYWTEVGGIVARCNIDACFSAEVIARIEPSNLNSPLRAGLVDITLDNENEYVYFGSITNHEIYRTDYDGTFVPEVIVSRSTLSGLYLNAFALDLANDFIYFSNRRASGSIYRCTLSAIDNQPCKSAEVEIVLSSNAGNPSAMKVDTINNLLYWIDDDTDTLKRMSLNTFIVENIVSGIPFLKHLDITMPDSQPAQE